MTINEFLEEIKTELEISSVTEITIETNLYSLNEWDSLNLLMLIDLIKTNFEIAINPDEFEGELIVKDLIEKIEVLNGDRIFD